MALYISDKLEIDFSIIKWYHWYHLMLCTGMTLIYWIIAHYFSSKYWLYLALLAMSWYMLTIKYITLCVSCTCPVQLPYSNYCAFHSHVSPLYDCYLNILLILPLLLYIPISSFHTIFSIISLIRHHNTIHLHHIISCFVLALEREECVIFMSFTLHRVKIMFNK